MDTLLLFDINRVWVSPFLDKVMVMASAFGVWQPFVVLLVGLVAWKGRFRGRVLLAVLALTIAVADGLVARSLKYGTDKPRPHQVVAGLVVRSAGDASPEILALGRPVETKPSRPSRKSLQGEGRSFPSAHVVNTFAAATATVLVLGARWVWLFGVAGIVAYSRVYTASHFPVDVFAGALIGLACGTAVPLILEAVWRWCRRRGRPRLAVRHPSLLAP